MNDEADNDGFDQRVERLAKATAGIAAPDDFTAAIMASLPANDGGLFDGLRRIGRGAVALAAVAAGVALIAAVEVDRSVDADTLVTFEPLETLD